jgi:thiol-disulfide isomerase/thioredoxin
LQSTKGIFVNIVLIVVLAIVVFFIAFQSFIYVKSKKMVGNSIPFDKIDKSITEKIKDKNSILYFHSPACHNCKTQTPIIDKLKKEFDSIISVDVSKDLNTARTFQIMGTPSLLFLGKQNIEGIYIGVKNENFIREKLQKLS